MNVDWEAEGLLEGLEGEARQARRELLDRLHDDGVPLDQLRRAATEGRLVFLPVERALGAGSEQYTARDVSERSGLDLDFLLALWRALGLARPDPDEPNFDDADVAAAENIKQVLDAGIPAEGVLEVSRVMSQGMAGVAAAAGQVFAQALIRPGDNERDLALRYGEAAGELSRRLRASAEHVLRLQQLEAVRRAAVDLTGQSGGLRNAQDVTVSFADLVGFTKLGERVPADELGAVAGRLTEMATEIASPPVRLVKTIGDAAMLVSPDTDALLAATLELSEAAEAEGQRFPSVHAGVAHGQALTRAGDWYGHPVNLASRITDFAKAGSVLAEASVREHTDGSYQWSFAGKRRLKGMREEVPLFRVRPAEEG